MKRDNRTEAEIIAEETQNLLKYKEEMRQLYASHMGNGHQKRLYIDGNGNYIVEHKGVEVLTTIQASLAVRKFFIEL